MTAAPSPLSGITILALEQAIAAPLCTRHLADLGARVIKIEQPGTGDASRHYDGVVRGLAAHFVWLNHGKQRLPDEDRVRHRADLDRIVGEWCAARDLAEIQRRADQAGIGDARLN